MERRYASPRADRKRRPRSPQRRRRPTSSPPAADRAPVEDAPGGADERVRRRARPQVEAQRAEGRVVAEREAGVARAQGVAIGAAGPRDELGDPVDGALARSPD